MLTPIIIFFLQPEEQARNSVFCDLLYVSPRNNLAPQICAYYNYFYYTHPSQRSVWQVDVYARLVVSVLNFVPVLILYLGFYFRVEIFRSGGLNGFLWLCQRNGYRPILPSPINGLEDITDNHVL